MKELNNVIVNSHILLYSAHDVYYDDYGENVHNRLLNGGFQAEDITCIL